MKDGKLIRMLRVNSMMICNNHGKNKNSDRNTARIFGMKVNVSSWMEVTA